jgi:hypothetical protein
MKRVYLIQGKVINLSGANIVNRYTQSTRERLTNMITVLHHIAFSLLLQFFLTSVPFADQIGTLVTNKLEQAGCDWKCSVNYIFYRCVLTQVNHSTYLLSSVIEDPFLYLTLLFNFCTHRFCLLSTNQNTLISCYLLQIGDKYTRYRV